jgi:hypothetical protein
MAAGTSPQQFTWLLNNALKRLFSYVTDGICLFVLLILFRVNYCCIFGFLRFFLRPSYFICYFCLFLSCLLQGFILIVILLLTVKVRLG